MNEVLSPRNHLIEYTKSYPDVWKQGMHLYSQKGEDQAFDWHDWCFVPIAGWLAIAGLYHDKQLDTVVAGPKLAALGAWRLTQSIYRIDADMYESLITTKLDGDMPVDVLYRLPEWCIYVETPGLTYGQSDLKGFFAYLDDDRKNSRHELRILLDLENDLTPIPIHLNPGMSLIESLKSVSDEAVKNRKYFDITGQFDLDYYESVNMPVLHKLLSLILYICSNGVEYSSQSKPSYAQPKKTKKGLKFFPPDKPRIWNLGIESGRKVRSFHDDIKHYQTKGYKRPHIRRAHWHGYWKGKRKNTDVSQRFELKWIPPIVVSGNIE